MKKLPTVVITNRVHAPVIDRIAGHAHVVANSGLDPWPKAELLAKLSEADAAITFMPDRVDEALLEQCPKLKMIACALKGYENFDNSACSKRNITVTVVEDLLTEPTAELAIGLMIAIGRHIVPADHEIRAGRFAGWRPKFYGTGLAGRTIGFVGMGAIGRAIAQRVQGFRMHSVYQDIRRLEADMEYNLGLEWVSFDEVLRVADYVMLCLPLTESTKHIINAATLRRLKPDAFLINPARGSLVDEAAVAAALRTDQLAGYAADVFEMEDLARVDRPTQLNATLAADRTRTLLTPHIGSAVQDVRLRIEFLAADAVLAFLAGRTPKGIVNKAPLAAKTTDA